MRRGPLFAECHAIGNRPSTVKITTLSRTRFLLLTFGFSALEDYEAGSATVRKIAVCHVKMQTTCRSKDLSCIVIVTFYLVTRFRR